MRLGTNRIFRSQRGISAIGSAVAIAIGVAVAGGIFSKIVEQTRTTASLKGAKEVAEQVNRTALESTMQLLQSRSLQKLTTNGVTSWSKITTVTSPSWTFTPGTASIPATLTFNLCDPRFADPSNPSSLTACASDIVHAKVILNAVSGGDNEVLSTASVPVTRGGTKMETASTRAVLNFSNVSCSGAPTVSPSATVLSGETFSLQISNVTPADAAVTLVSTGAVFAGVGTKTLSLTAPIIALGQPSQTLTYVARVTAANGASTECPAVTVTVSACKPYMSEEPVKEVYRQLMIASDAQLNQTTVSANASQIAAGTLTVEGLWQSLYNSDAYGTRVGVLPAPAYPYQPIPPIQRELAVNAIAMARHHLGKQEDDATTKIRADYVRQMQALLPSCVYSVTSPCNLYTTYGNFPKLSLIYKALPEFLNAPNSGAYTNKFLDEQYERYWGITTAQMTPAEQTQRTAFLESLKTGTIQFAPKTVVGSVLNQLTSSSRYTSRGGDAGEGVNSMYRVLYGRTATDTEAAYYSTLQSSLSVTPAYVSQRLRSNAEFRSLGGCQVPPPLPVCNISAPQSLRPGQIATLTLTAFESLTNATWDGVTLAISGNGAQTYTKSITGGAIGSVQSTSATVRSAGGEVTCSASVQTKREGRSVMARRGCSYCAGPDLIRCNNTRNDYEWWRVFLQTIPDLDFVHSNIAGWGTAGWDSSDAGTWFPYMKTNGWIYCTNAVNFGPICSKLAAAPPVTKYEPTYFGNYCNATYVPMPATWTYPADGISYQLMTNPFTGLAANAFDGGVCGSAEVPCYLKIKQSPLYIELGSVLTEFIPGASFDMGDGKLNYFWPKPSPSGFWVALDRNGNGKIDGGEELFGNVTPDSNGQKAFENGFAALAIHDANHDKFIDAMDPIFSRLLLWGDLNRNGISEASELHGIATKNVKRIDLSYLDIQELNDFYGNASNQRSIVEMEDGSWKIAYDLWIMPSGSVAPSARQR